MAEKKEYRSSIRSRRLIREAFLKLLHEKEFEKITVTDIANLADLNRSTFYAHYPDVYGLVEEIEDEIINKHMEVVQQMKYLNIIKNPTPYIKSLSAILEENMYLYKRIGHTEQLYQHLDKYRKLIAESLLNDTSIPEKFRRSTFLSIHIHFFLGGIMNTYQQWLEGDLTSTLDEISEEIATIIKKSAAEFSDQNWLN